MFCNDIAIYLGGYFPPSLTHKMELFSLEEKVAYLPKTSPALDHIPKVECTLVNILSGS
jgi:hypothetical protein